jgi:hypothetical protein
MSPSIADDDAVSTSSARVNQGVLKMNKTFFAGVVVTAFTMFACATAAPEQEPTTIRDARVAADSSGRVTVSGEGGEVVADESMVHVGGNAADESAGGIGIRQRVGCQISSCESCTCYPDGACICTNCKCLSR